MLDIAKFLIRHLEEIIIIIYSLCMILIALVSLIVLICKKLKATDNDLVYVLDSIPDWIIDAEENLIDGKEKYTVVFSKAIKMLSTLKKMSDEDVLKKYSFIIDSSIEKILSTPMKKEVSHEKNNEKMEG